MVSEGSKGSLTPVDSTAFLPVAGKLRGDFSYRLIEGVSLGQRQLEHSLWTGAVLRECSFTDVSFDRCDFAGTKFVDCEFVRCSFEPDEMRSCILNRVRFVDCRLSGLQCVSSQFRDCTFLSCDMSRSVIRECNFLDCSFDDVPFRGCSVTLNHFRNSTFRKVIFADATILFLIFDDCAFSGCQMNAETIGFTFGLSLEDLEAFELVYLGEMQERPGPGELLSALLETYRARRWILGVCLLKINFGIDATYLALHEFARALVDMVAQEPRVDWDEIAFLLMVLEQLQSREQLPFMGIWEVNGAVASVIAALAREQSDFTVNIPPAENLAWRFRRIATQRMTEVSQELVADDGDIRAIEVHVALTRLPAAELPEIITAGLGAESGIRASDFKLIRSWEASWHEIWQISLAALGAINVTLVLVDSTWEKAAKIWKRGQAVRDTLKKKPAKGKTSRVRRIQAKAGLPGPSHTIDLPTVANAVERATAELRVITDADRDALVRLDMAVQRIGLLNDPSIRRLLEYAHPNLSAVGMLSAISPTPAPTP